MERLVITIFATFHIPMRPYGWPPRTSHMCDICTLSIVKLFLGFIVFWFCLEISEIYLFILNVGKKLYYWYFPHKTFAFAKQIRSLPKKLLTKTLSYSYIVHSFVTKLENTQRMPLAKE